MNIVAYNKVKPEIAGDVFIAPGTCIIGDVVIGGRSSVWFNCVIRADVDYIRIGKGTNIQDGTVIHVASGDGPTIIGDGVTIGHKCLLHACRIEDHAFVGMGSIVMDGAVIESGGMLAAGSLLTAGKVVKTGELWAGLPAKLFRSLTNREIETEIKISAKKYAELAAEYLQMQRRHHN
ncbi:gamma carbonic anhydrase family protein [Rickettsiales bacterium]|nr:gamma carbonic anhydrase family protein [Rickettsiales bacterium]